jgi:hypothetical protein
VELAILYPQFISVDKDFGRKNEPVNEQDKRGCGEQYDGSHIKSVRRHGRYSLLYSGHVVKIETHGYNEDDREGKKNFCPTLVL